jgi:hypothetical protein
VPDACEIRWPEGDQSVFAVQPSRLIGEEKQLLLGTPEEIPAFGVCKLRSRRTQSSELNWFYAVNIDAEGSS